MAVNLTALRDKTLTQGIATSSAFVVPASIQPLSTTPVPDQSAAGSGGWPGLTPTDALDDGTQAGATGTAGPGGGSGVGLSGGGTPSSLPASSEATAASPVATSASRSLPPAQAADRYAAEVAKAQRKVDSGYSARSQQAMQARQSTAPSDARRSLLMSAALANKNDPQTSAMLRQLARSGVPGKSASPKKPAPATAKAATPRPIVESTDWWTATQAKRY